MNYIKMSKHDTSNGVGIRVVLWVSGCSLRCPGCHNQEAQDPDTGKEFTAESMAELIEALDKPYILNQEWDDIIDEEDTDDLTVGYEVVEIWEIN